jgi:hypothetical protein
MLPDNNWYGHRSILLNYLGLKDRSVFASIMHGWVSQCHYRSIKKRSSTFFPYLVWNKKVASFFFKKKIKNVIPIGAPFLYLCRTDYIKLAKKNLSNFLTAGLIFFPPHSGQDYKRKINHEKFIKKIKKINKGPYTVCLYYYDIKAEIVAIYKNYNFRVICCVKSRTDLNSLYNLYEEISKHKYVVSGELNSPLFYSMYLKKQTRVILDEDELKKNNDQISSDALFLNKFYKKKYPKLFNSFFPIKEALKLSKFELGVNCVKSKEELSRILGVNSMLKYFLSIFFSILYDLKYGYHLRKGIDQPKKLLQKYIKATRQ